MKKLLLTVLVGLGLVVGVNAFDTRDTTINIYGVNARTDGTQKSHAGFGVMFDSEDVKVKLEGTSDFIKSGLVLKFNPITDEWYFKVGANCVNQKMYAPDNTNARVNQYSGALSTGYMLTDYLYAEVGVSSTKLKGTSIGADYEVVDETTNLGYIEIAKRWESLIGTIDTTANAGKVYHELSADENSYGLGIDYYIVDNAKVGYKYQYEKANMSSTYSARYGLLFAEYTDNISTKTYHVTAGLSIAFTDIMDISTYAMPQNIKPHLSELHRFEEVSFGNNMEIQSTIGVQKTAAAIARDAVDSTAPNTPAVADLGSTKDNTPTWTMPNTDPDVDHYSVSLDGGGWFNVNPGGTYTSGAIADGVHTFSIKAVDAAGNVSTADTSSVTVDTTAPTTMSISPVPDTKSTVYTNLVLNLDDSILGGTITNLTSSTGGTITNASINGSGDIIFDWVTPPAGGSQLRVFGTDAASNAYDVTLNVTLPN